MKIEKDDPTDRMLEIIDRETGEILSDQRMSPEPGFDINPGKSYWKMMTGVMTDRVENWPDEIASLALPDLIASDAFAGWYTNKKAQGNWPVGKISDEQAERIVAHSKAAILSEEAVVEQLQNYPYIEPADYVFVQQAIESGEVVQDGEDTLSFLLEKEGMVNQVTVTKKEHGLFVTSFNRVKK